MATNEFYLSLDIVAPNGAGPCFGENRILLLCMFIPQSPRKCINPKTAVISILSTVLTSVYLSVSFNISPHFVIVSSIFFFV